MADFNRRDLDQYADSLADYMPGGQLFESKSIQDSNFRKLLLGMAGELFSANGLLMDYNGNIIPDQTEKFLDEWESALGIPDDCFSGTGTSEERRRDILAKLAALGVQTASDFESLALLFGVVAVVGAGLDEITFPVIFPIPMFTTETDARFTITVRFVGVAVSVFPFTFPILFGTPEQAIVECLFETLKPANCNLLFLES